MSYGLMMISSISIQKAIEKIEDYGFDVQGSLCIKDNLEIILSKSITPELKSVHPDAKLVITYNDVGANQPTEDYIKAYNDLLNHLDIICYCDASGYSMPMPDF